MDEQLNQEANRQYAYRRLVESGSAPTIKGRATNLDSNQHVHSLEPLEGKKLKNF